MACITMSPPGSFNLKYLIDKTYLKLADRHLFIFSILFIAFTHDPNLIHMKIAKFTPIFMLDISAF